MNRIPSLHEASKAGGAPRLWTRVIGRTLADARVLLPPGSRILEVGYGDGLLSCHLAEHCGWHILGLEIDALAHATAQTHAKRLALEDRIDFRLVGPEETWSFQGQFDGVFIKTVLYNASTLDQYARWLDWVVSVLRPRGVFVNFENGKANRLTYYYRRIRRRYYADLCMFDGRIARLYETRFADVDFSYFGAISQFLAPIPLVYETVAAVEERWLRRTADNSYIAAIVARSAS